MHSDKEVLWCYCLLWCYKSWDKHKGNLSDIRTKLRKLGELWIAVVVESQKTKVCPASPSQSSTYFLITGTTTKLSMVLLSGAHVKLIGGRDGINGLILPSSCYWEKTPKWWMMMVLPIAWIPSEGAGWSVHPNQRSRWAHAWGWGASWSDPSWRPAPENCTSFSFRIQVREKRFDLSSKWNTQSSKQHFLKSLASWLAFYTPIIYPPTCVTACYFHHPYVLTPPSLWDTIFEELWKLNLTSP